MSGRFRTKRANHIIGLDTVYDDQWQSERPDDLVQGLDLHAQVIGHRRPIGLVLGVNIVAKSFPLGIEHHRNVIRLLVPDQFTQHIQDAIDGTGRMLIMRQWRQPMIGPEQVGATVYQHQFFSILLIHLDRLQCTPDPTLTNIDAR